MSSPTGVGYGDSPPAKVVDFEADGRDIARLLGDGSHLIGFSYAGVALGHPAVAALVTRLEPVFAGARRMTPEEYDRRFDEALGFNHVEAPDTARLDASRKERRPWEAHIPLETLRAQPFPKLVFRGRAPRSATLRR